MTAARAGLGVTAVRAVAGMRQRVQILIRVRVGVEQGGRIVLLRILVGSGTLQA